jgi:uncharacterized protein (DUF924 family)
MQGIAEVLTFWFSEESRRHWFAPTPEFDQEIRERFADLSARAASGQLSAWSGPRTVVSRCASCSIRCRATWLAARHGPSPPTPKPATSPSERSAGVSIGLPPERTQFLYLPFSHSERLADQERALALFEAAGLDDALAYVRGHLAIIRRFGRFPHRNAILGRSSTPEERSFWRRIPRAMAKASSDRTG